MVYFNKVLSHFEFRLQLLTDVKMITGVDLQNSVEEKLGFLATKLCTNNQYPTGILVIRFLCHRSDFYLDSTTIRCFKILCGMLNDSWKHYLCFYPEVSDTFSWRSLFQIK
jgi:hypothetical protein